MIPSEASEGSDEDESEPRGEDRMKVAETDVISRTRSDRVGRHGRMECHCDASLIVDVGQG